MLLDTDILNKIISQKESGHIEFKREWYWDLNGEITNTEKNKCWGEFIKDFLGLTNANHLSFNQDRYLVIGFDENKNEFYDFQLTLDKFTKISNDSRHKVQEFISSEIDFTIYFFTYQSKNGLAIKIQQPTRIHYLSKAIQTKTITYNKHTLLGRISVDKYIFSDTSKYDSVNNMPYQEIILIQKLMEQKFPNFTPLDGKVKPKKTIQATIASYLEINKSLILDDSESISKDHECYAEIYKIQNKTTRENQYFAYISDKNIKKSLVALLEKNVKIDVLLIDKPTTSTEERIRYIKRLTLEENIKKIYFIDDFGKDILYQEYLETLFFEKLPNTDNFIDSFIENTSSEMTSSVILSNWLGIEDSPICVLIGEGGVGKTTLVKEILNKTLSDNGKDYLLFLDASNLIEQLKLNSRINSIYDLYKINFNDSKNILTETLFKLSIDNGSFIIVLDGLDEIISGMGIKFDLDNFLSNIFNEYCFNLSKTKIIMTCRDSIWSESGYNDPRVSIFKLKPFNEDQARLFFETCFTKNKQKDMKKVRKAIGYAQEIITDRKYNPFVLETIRTLVHEDDQDISELIDIDESDEINFHLTQKAVDRLIYAVCKRETRKHAISTSKQLEILCEISLYKDCTIDGHQFNVLINNVIQNSSSNHLSIIRSHPFLYCDKNRVGFKYDFLKQFFMLLSVVRFIANNDVKDKNHDNLLNTISMRISHANDFTKEIARRLDNISKDELAISFLNLMSSIKNSDYIEDKELIISNLFILYISILKHQNKINDKNEYTNVLFEMFGEKGNIINNLILKNISDEKLTFNFYSYKFINTYIDGYAGFNKCIFSSNENKAFFDDSCTINILSSKDGKYNFLPENFSEKIIASDETRNILEKISHNISESKDKSERLLLKFIALFKSNGTFRPKKQEEIRAKKGSDVDIMLKSKVIINHKESKINQPEFIVNPEYKNDLFRFIETGQKTKKIRDIIESLNT